MASSSWVGEHKISNAQTLPAAPEPRRIRNHLLGFLACLALAILFTLPGSLSPRSALLGFAGDNYQHAWFLWHFAQAVSRLQNPFFTNLIYYPHRVNLAWSTTDPLAGILVLPVSLALGPVAAYNCALILQFALAAFFARVLCLRVCGNQAAALVGGICFGFSPYMLAQALGHLSLATTFPLPLFLLALVAVMEKEPAGWKDGVYLGLALFLTALAHYNYTVFCLLLAVVIVAVDFAAVGPAVLRRIWKPLLVAALTFVIAFSPLLILLVGNRADIPRSRSAGHFGIFSADVLGFLIPSWNHVIVGRFVRGLNPNLFLAGYEGTVYFGIFILLVACAGYWKGRGKHRLWTARALVTAIVFYLLSLGPRLRMLGRELPVPGPAVLFYKVGFARFVSAPARFQVVTALSLAILVSLGLAFFLKKMDRWEFQYGALAGIAGLLLLDLLTVPFPRASIVDPVWTWGLAASEEACSLPLRIQKGTVLTFPMIDAPYILKSMWMQVTDGGRYALVDGYVSYASDQLWTEFYAVPMVRSLLTLQGRWNFPADPAADKKTLPAAIEKLNLSGIVVFDSPQKSAAIAYLEKVTGERGMNGGSCTIFETASASAASKK